MPYAVTAQSPSTTHIAWTGVNIVYNGANYAITNGNTTTFGGIPGPYKFIWFDAAVSTTILQQSNNKPSLAGNACMVFINNAGVPQSVLESDGTAQFVADGVVDTGSLVTGAVTGVKIASNAGILGSQLSGTANITGSQMSSTAGIVGSQLSSTAGIVGSQLSSTAGIVGAQLANKTIDAARIADNTITSTQVATNAGITGGQLSSTAGIVGAQLANKTVDAARMADNTITSLQVATNAGITGSQLSSTAGIVGSQIANGSISALKTAIFQHLIY